MGFWAAALPFLGEAAGAAASFGVDMFTGDRREDAQFHFAEKEREHQRQFAQNALQWRVADAKAAGLHPLSAVSAQLPSYQPMVLGDTGPSLAESMSHQRFGSGLASTIEEMHPDKLSRPSWERKVMNSNLEQQAKLLDVQLRHATSNANRSEIQETMDQIELNRMLFGTKYTNKEADALKEDPLFEITPNQITAARRGRPWEGAGPGKPFWDTYHLDQGLQIDLPQGSNAGEAVEAISESKAIMAGVIAYNVKKYGPKWKAAFDRWWKAREESSRPPGGISDIPVF